MIRRLLVAVVVAAALLAEAGAAPPDTSPIVTTLALFAGTPSGLRLSRDWGTTWDRRDPAVPDGLETAGGVRVILPLGPTVYLGAEGGLFVSQDFGRTWEKLGVLGSVQCILLSRYFNVEPTIFVGTREGLLKSEDAGHAFHATALRGTPVTRLEWPGPALVAATGRGVLVSTDSGASFGGPGEGLAGGGVRAMALSSFYPIDPVLFAGVGSHGVYRSGDGARTWTSAGLADHVVTDLAWLEIYFAQSPAPSAQLIAALHELVAEDDVRFARLEGWALLVANKPDEAKVKLSAIAERDPLSAMGMIRIAAKDESQKDAVKTSAQTLLNDNRAGRCRGHTHGALPKFPLDNSLSAAIHRTRPLHRHRSEHVKLRGCERPEQPSESRSARHTHGKAKSSSSSHRGR